MIEALQLKYFRIPKRKIREEKEKDNANTTPFGYVLLDVNNFSIHLYLL